MRQAPRAGQEGRRQVEARAPPRAVSASNRRERGASARSRASCNVADAYRCLPRHVVHRSRQGSVGTTAATRSAAAKGAGSKGEVRWRKWAGAPLRHGAVRAVTSTHRSTRRPRQHKRENIATRTHETMSHRRACSDVRRPPRQERNCACRRPACREERSMFRPCRKQPRAHNRSGSRRPSFTSTRTQHQNGVPKRPQPASPEPAFGCPPSRLKNARRQRWYSSAQMRQA